MPAQGRALTSGTLSKQEETSRDLDGAKEYGHCPLPFQ
jgi:hypothetical protein